jgi:hypothetical protein
MVVANNSDTKPETDGLVKYASTTTLILIDSESGQVGVRFVRVQDNERYYLDPVSIHEYLNTNATEKQILLSVDPKDEPAATEIFNRKFLLLAPHWRNNGETLDLALERQLRNYSNWLKTHAHLCISGDFSQWPYFYDYKINRLIADDLRKGGKATVKAIIKDEKGALRTVERPIFQREKDHAATLKKEILGI